MPPTLTKPLTISVPRSTATSPTNPMITAPQGRFRFTLTGFSCERETRDHLFEADGKGDEVYFLLDRAFVDENYNVIDRRRIRTVNFGDVNRPPGPPRVQAGTRSSLGGIRTGDTYPTSEPWRLTAPPTADQIPWNLGEFDLRRGGGAALFIVSLWEWDGDEGVRRVFHDRIDSYWKGVGSPEARASRAGSSAESFFLDLRHDRPVSDHLIDQVLDGRDYPIGLAYRAGWRRAPGERDYLYHCPCFMVMTYDEALRVTRTSNGRGLGVLDFAAEDWARNVGRYTFHVLVEKIG